MIPIEDIAKLSLKERTHANIGALLYGMRDEIEQLIAIRVGKYGELLDDEDTVGELMAIKQNVEFLLSDIYLAMRLKAK